MSEERKVDWVLLDAMGVIYRDGDDFNELMVPFLRENGCDLPDDMILREFERCTMGYISSEDMWHNCGLEEIDAFDLEFTFRYQLSRGLCATLDTLRAAGFRLACLSNGPAEWSRLLRRRFGLERWIEKWIISGEVRRRKPDPQIYEIALAALETTPNRCLFVDDNPRNLDIATRMGFGTYRFDSRRSEAQFAEIVKIATDSE